MPHLSYTEIFVSFGVARLHAYILAFLRRVAVPARSAIRTYPTATALIVTHTRQFEQGVDHRIRRIERPNNTISVVFTERLLTRACSGDGYPPFDIGMVYGVCGVK